MRQIALLIESSRSYGRGLLKGVASYVRVHGGWSLRHQEMSIDAAPPRWLESWDGDGILARIETDAFATMIQKMQVPTVDLRCAQPIAGVPQLNTDDEAVVRIAIDHLRDRGMKRFGFCGFAFADYSIRRREYFHSYLRTLGVEPMVYESKGPRILSTVGAEQQGMLDHDGVTQWLKSLPKPIGVLATNDIRGQQLLQCCQDAGIAVPDDVAVVGVDNDDVICSLCQPNLTSVELDTEAIGHAAATLLDRMIDGEQPPPLPIYIPPQRVIIRGSSDIVAVEDRDIAAAYRYLRENACNGISVDDVVQQVPLSRRSLERRIRQHFGRSPAELIAEIKLARIKQLLEESDFKHNKIARLSGFVHDEHMAVFFRRQVGVPPGKYRKQWREGRGK